MKELVDQGYFSLSTAFFGEDSQPVVGGGTVRDWKREYGKRLINEVCFKPREGYPLIFAIPACVATWGTFSSS